MKMEKISNTRWTILALICIGVIVMFISGCSVLEEQMLKAKGLVGMGEQEVIECTSNTESGCEGWVSETTGSTTE